MSSSANRYPNSTCPTAAAASTQPLALRAPFSPTLGGGLATAVNVPLPVQPNGHAELPSGHAVNVSIEFAVDKTGPTLFQVDVEGIN